MPSSGGLIAPPLSHVPTDGIPRNFSPGLCAHMYSSMKSRTRHLTDRLAVGLLSITCLCHEDPAVSSVLSSNAAGGSPPHTTVQLLARG